jgi:glycosyltransferase involved in cell wall biosynthesis
MSTRPVRVAVVADGRGFGGAQVSARSLVAHAPPGVHCDVVTTAEHAPHLARWSRRAAGGSSSSRRRCARERPRSSGQALAALAPDLVQVNLVDPTSMLAALDAASAVAPTVATLHMSGEVPREQVASVRAAYARLGHVVAVSREFAALAADVLGVERLTHVLNGVDPVERVRPPGGAVPVVAALGRLTAQKGFDVLLEAVRLLVEDGVRLELLLGGEGREATALASQAAGLPVRLLGFQDGPRALFARADLFVLPSRVEALPLVLVEAVSAGLPAVATDVGDVREALDGVVVVVPPEDPVALAEGLRRLLADPAERAQRGEAGARLARERLTARRMATQTWAAFLPSARPSPAPPGAPAPR